MKKFGIILLISSIVFVITVGSFYVTTSSASACTDYNSSVNYFYSTTNQYPYVWHTFYKCYGSLINRSQTHWTPHTGSYNQQWWELETFSGYSYNNSSYYSIIGYNTVISAPGGQRMSDRKPCLVGSYDYLSISMPIVSNYGGKMGGDKGYYYQVTWETFTNDSTCQIIFQEITPDW